MSKPNSSGYSLDQLLEWCANDRLIDGFSKSDDSVVIFHNGSRHVFDYVDAHSYLKGIFTASHRRDHLDDPNAA